MANRSARFQDFFNILLRKGVIRCDLNVHEDMVKPEYKEVTPESEEIYLYIYCRRLDS